MIGEIKNKSNFAVGALIDKLQDYLLGGYRFC